MANNVAPSSRSFTKCIEVYGHRGARAHAPENTLAGYTVGLKLGIDWVDIDIGITRDGVIIAYHDIWLNPDILHKNGKFWAKSKEDFFNSLRKDNLNQLIQPFLIKNIMFSDLQEYEAGILNQNSPYAKYFPKQQQVPGTRIPSLQNVIDEVNRISGKRVNFQIEIKNDPRYPDWTVTPKEFASNLHKLLKQNNLFDKVEIQSADWQPLYELQKLEPTLKTGYLIEPENIKLMHSSNPVQAGLWSGGHLLKDYNNSLPQMVKALGGSCYEPEDILLTRADLDEAHHLGLKVVVWTQPERSGKVFDLQLIDQLISWGVDGIITDDPEQLVARLAALGYMVPKRFNPS